LREFKAHSKKQKRNPDNPNNTGRKSHRLQCAQPHVNYGKNKSGKETPKVSDTEAQQKRHSKHDQQDHSGCKKEAKKSEERMLMLLYVSRICVIIHAGYFPILQASTALPRPTADPSTPAPKYPRGVRHIPSGALIIKIMHGRIFFSLLWFDRLYSAKLDM
jgi:hypothetical protein